LLHNFSIKHLKQSFSKVMGICGTKEKPKQILLCGLDGAGKTTLLYTHTMHADEFTTEPTFGKFKGFYLRF